MQRIRSFSCLLLVLLLAQCSSSPSLPRVVTINKGERTTVVAQTKGVPLKLVNASATSRDKVYSDPAADLSMKIVEDPEMQRLLDVLANEGFFDRAGASVAPRNGSITVEQSGRRWVLNPPPVADPQYKTFVQYHEYVRATFNQTMGFQTRKDISTDDLVREQEKREAEQKELIRSKTQGGGKQEPPR
jgi:hypothetical protein